MACFFLCYDENSWRCELSSSLRSSTSSASKIPPLFLHLTRESKSPNIPQYFCLSNTIFESIQFFSEGFWDDNFEVAKFSKIRSSSPSKMSGIEGQTIPFALDWGNWACRQGNWKFWSGRIFKNKVIITILTISIFHCNHFQTIVGIEPDNLHFIDVLSSTWLS